MIPVLVVFLYLAVVLYIGIFAFRHSSATREAEDYFLAGRSLGPFVFLMSLFGSNMTAFAILGASGHAFHNGIVTFGLMASSSALVVPLSFFLLGTRVWALGRRFGFITPVQLFRDRWECSHIGTVIFAVQAALLVPYVVIGVMGGGTALSALSGGRLSFAFGGALVALVVMSYVFLGGMRGTAWVNTFQASLFLLFGAIALAVIGAGMGGFRASAEALLDSPLAWLLTRERVPPALFFSYTFIPLSSIAFPHITIFCLTARRLSQFKRTVVLYPLCIAGIFLPSVFLGVMANRVTDSPKVREKQEARQALANPGAAALTPEERGALRARANADDVLLILLERYAPIWLTGLLGAGIMAAVMATDSQILALSTMFTEDVLTHYGGKQRFSEHAQVQMARGFVVALTVIAYLVALRVPESIFALAVQYAFTGFAALSSLLVAAIFWPGSTRWGALAATLWAAGSVAAVAVFQALVPAPLGPPSVVLRLGSLDVLARTASGTAVLGFMPVVPIVLGAALLMAIVSALTPKPSPATLERYFPGRRAAGMC